MDEKWDFSPNLRHLNVRRVFRASLVESGINSLWLAVGPQANHDLRFLTLCFIRLVSLLLRARDPVDLSDNLPPRGPGVGWYYGVKCKASRGYLAEELCPAALHQSHPKVFSAVTRRYHSFSVHTWFRCICTIFCKLLILL